MDVRGFGDYVSLAFDRTQGGLATATRRLASGLRIQSAADDPSGLAIAESLRSKVEGLDQGSRNIQDAANALTVADGAMAEIGSILQRMRALIVEARSDLVDPAQRNDLQVELNALRQEIDTIAQRTTFNGRALLDGSLSSALPQPARVLIPVNDGLSGGGTVIDTTFDPAEPAVGVNAQQIVQQATVTAYDPVTDSLTLSVNISSQDPSFGGPQTATVAIGNGTNYPTFGFPPTPGNPTFTQTDASSNPVLSFNIGTLSAADVGKTSIIVSLPAEQKAPGSALTVNSGDAEGSVVTADLPNVSSATLGVNDVQLSPTDDLINQADEYRVDYAIAHLASLRATVGAQTVALHEAAGNAQVASVEYTQSESAIRDANIGAETVEFTKLTILRTAQTDALANLEHLQQNLAQVLALSIVG